MIDSPKPRAHAQEPSAHDGLQDHEGLHKVRWDRPRRVCLLTTVHRERALSRALVQHLSAEIPDVDFELAPVERPHAVWICGYEPGHAQLVRALRMEHPRAMLVVTGRGPIEPWEQEVRASGADFVCTWPVPFAQLSRLFHSHRVLPPLR